MKNPFVRRQTFSNLWWFLAIAVAACWLCYQLRPILTPFIIGALLTYICLPLQDWLVRHKINQNLAAILVILLMTLVCLAFLLILIPLVFEQFHNFYQGLQNLLRLGQEQLQPQLEQRFGLRLDLHHIFEWLQDNGKGLQDAMPDILRSIGTRGLALISLLASFLLVPVVFFYFLRDAEKYMPRVFRLVPRRYAHTFDAILKDINLTLGEFMRGQLTVMLIMSCFYTIGLGLVGLKAALAVGLVTGLLTFVPYVGALTGLLLGTLSAFAQGDGSWASIWPTLTVFLCGQGVEGYIVTPRFVGERIGLHPVAVIFALMAFGQLFGFVGVLMALPAAAVLQVGLRHTIAAYLKSKTYLADHPH